MLWSYRFGGGETTNLAWLLERYIYLHAGHTYVQRDTDGTSIVATYTIRPPTLVFTTWAKIRAGLFMFPIRYGYVVYARLEEAFHKAPGTTYMPMDAYYVTSFAVREESRGQA